MSFTEFLFLKIDGWVEMRQYINNLRGLVAYRCIIAQTKNVTKIPQFKMKIYKRQKISMFKLNYYIRIKDIYDISKDKKYYIIYILHTPGPLLVYNNM